MDKVISKAKELLDAINQLPEVKEYLYLKSLISKDESLSELRHSIAIATSENNTQEKESLLKIYNANPLVNNYYIAKQQVSEILKTVRDIIK